MPDSCENFLPGTLKREVAADNEGIPTRRMANADTMAPIRIEDSVSNCQSISDYQENYTAEDSSADPSHRFRSREKTAKKLETRNGYREANATMNPFDQIIEKIENLCFTREHLADVNRNELCMVQAKNRANEDNRQDNRQDGPEEKYDKDNNNENEAEEDGEDREKKDETTTDQFLSGKTSTSSNDDDYTSDEYEEDTDDSSETLIERGPIRPQLYPIRGKPYSMMDNRPSLSPEKTESIALDYETTAEQILRDKEYSEKLNPCLDQLESSAKRIYPVADNFWTDGPGDRSELAQFENCSSNDVGSVPVIDEPGEDSLLKILSRGGFQAAQVFSDASNKSVSPPATKTWPDSPVNNCNVAAALTDSRGSSRAQSPGSGINLESPLMHINLTYSPIGSPQIAATYRVAPGLSSSSSSNQSYCDTPSPLNYQAPLNPRLEDRLGQDLENFPIWNDGYESSGTVVDTADTIETIHTIDSSELQLVEEVLRDLGAGYETEEAQVVPNSQQGPPASYEEGRGVARCESNSAVNHTSVDLPKQVRNTLRESSSRSCEKSIDPGAVSFNVTSGEVKRNLTNEFCDLNLVSASFNYARESTIKNCEIGKSRKPQLLRNEYSFLDSSDVYANYSGAPTVSPFAQQHPKQNFNATISSPEGRCEDFQIPETVTTFDSGRGWKNTDRAIAPWPSLNLPSSKASERLKEELCPKEVQKAMRTLLMLPMERLTKADNDGYTQLMCLVGNPAQMKKMGAFLVPLVERLGNEKGALSRTNNRGEDALYLAAMNCATMSYVAGYLAAAMLRKGIDISQRLYHTRGDTLIHSIAAQGDSHGEVLAELLAVRTVQGNAVFDLSKRNYDGRTALHVAVESHDPVGRGVSSVATVRLLLENGADLKIRETRCGDTALHMAVSLSCDPALVKVLLMKATPDVVNATNYVQNTALHMAAAVPTSVSLQRQREVCWLLTQAGGQTNLQNRQGRTALSLVAPERKETIKRIFYKKL